MSDIETYIQQFPDEVQEILQTIRKLINDNAPGANEHFAYGMPAFKLYKKPLVYFAAFKNHIGFYATPSGHTEFQEELSKYRHGKGSVQFPLDKPIPYKLIERIVKFRVTENYERAINLITKK
ncbi:MAG: iron chaperone [Bacteroidota bacterium]